MTVDQKDRIDVMDYRSMLRLWRFAPDGDPLFQGDAGKYFAKVIQEKREKVGNAAHVAASKSIGWQN